MKESEFDGVKDIKELFRMVLGSEVKVKDNIDATEEGVFCVFVEKLEQSYCIERTIYECSRIDISSVTDNLWIVIENCLKMLYGEEISKMVYWYIFDRIGKNGKPKPLVDMEGKKHKINTPLDLWRISKRRITKK